MTKESWSLERVKERLAPLAVKARPTQPSPGQGYFEAAAVLAWFDPSTLVPLGSSNPIGLDELLQASVDDGKRWRLRRSRRVEVLQTLLERNAVGAALAANPKRPDDPEQRLLEAALAGHGIAIESLRHDEVGPAANVIDALSGIVPGLPDAALLRDRLAFEELIAPLRGLVGEHFRGRSAELASLQTLIDAPPGGLDKRPPMIVHGIGGMGKSTLIARFVLDHVDRPPDQRLPFAYLDFDRQDLSIRTTLLLVAEILRQLGIQFPAQRAAADAARKQIIAGHVESGLESMGTRTLTVSEALSLLREVGREDAPFLLVLDTFEEVQYASAALLASLWELLDVFQNALPRATIVIAGRAPVGDVSWFARQELALGELDREAALGFLAARRVVDPRLAAAIFDSVRGNPLSLSLAADLAQQGDFTPDAVFQTRAYQAQIQGQLYRRILAHIGDEDVRKLAHPGLVLRIVTPELIEEVLAEPCGVAARGRGRQLFDQLAREVSLVVPVADADEPMLRHRQDVRRVMLDLLTSDQPQRVAELHDLAVAYHAKHDALWHRAEELYHRLRRCDSIAEVDERWLPGVEDRLRGALEELGPEHRAYLASRLGIDLDESARRAADHESWERDAAKRVNERLFVGRPEHLEEALAILAERSERKPDSPLILLEAKVLERLDRIDAAYTVATAAVAAARRTADEDRLIDALRTLARLSGSLGRRQMARGAIDEAHRLARTQDPVTRLTIALERHAQLDGRAKDESAVETFELAARVPVGEMTPQVVDAVRFLRGSTGLTGPQRVRLRDAVVSAFDRAELDILLSDNFNVRLDHIVAFGSLLQTAAELVDYLERRGQIEPFVINMVEARPNRADLRALARELAPEFFTPIDTPARPLVGGLRRSDVLALRRAVMGAGLSRRRTDLMHGLPLSIVDSLPRDLEPAAQHLSDIDELARVGPLSDGRYPVEVWLENAHRLTGLRREAEVFQAALARLRARRDG